MENEFLDVIREISDKLVTRNLNLAIAESCTGGFISNAVSNLPGSSKFFELSVVSYSEEAKKSVLGVSASLLRKHGMVSEETAVAMVEGVRKVGHTDIALAVTGVAGPERMEDKDVGLVFIAVSVRGRVESEGRKLDGDREEIKRQASLEALRFLNRVLELWL
jgi:PncC family amidohydrolase